jgi:hypothetical protein
MSRIITQLGNIFFINSFDENRTHVFRKVLDSDFLSVYYPFDHDDLSIWQICKGVIHLWCPSNSGFLGSATALSQNFSPTFPIRVTTEWWIFPYNSKIISIWRHLKYFGNDLQIMSTVDGPRKFLGVICKLSHAIGLKGVWNLWQFHKRKENF